jgi:hypothetical protein
VLSLPFHTKITILREIKQREKEIDKIIIIKIIKQKMKKKKTTHFRK